MAVSTLHGQSLSRRDWLVTQHIMFDDDCDGGIGPQVLETFKFNFAIENGQQGDTGDQLDATATHTTLDQQPSSTPDPSSLIPGQQLDPATLATRLLQHSPTSSPPTRLVITPTFSPYRLAVATVSSIDLASITQRSDVVPSVYEGGYKLWECAIDLCRHLHRLQHESSTPLDCSRVLELGCGHGLCGLWALMGGAARHVTFHDLNQEVLTDLTLPTIALNLQLHHTPPLSQPATVDELSSRTAFLSGDWSSPSLLALLPRHTHSLVLTSDTLYHASSIAPLLRVVQHCLAADGVALVASKRYYFGVGGGTVELMRWVERDGTMVCEVVEVLEDGHSNIREVVRLRWKDGQITDHTAGTAHAVDAMSDQ